MNISKFNISGNEVTIRVFFSVNCLEKLFESYSQINDYRQAFSLVVFQMYSKTQRGEEPERELLENDFLTASDDELSKILDYILTNDERAREEYDNIECEDIYERFYKANDTLLKRSLKPLADSFKGLNKIYTPQYTGIQKMLEQQSALMKNIQIPNFDAINNVIATFQVQAKSINEQFGSFNFDYLKNVPKFDFPEIQLVLDNIPKVAFDVASIMLPFANQVAEMQDSLRTSMQAAISALTQPLAGIDFSLLRYHREWNEKHDFLVKYEWFYLNELSDEIIDLIFNQRDVISAEEIDMIIVQYFRENNCFILKQLVKKWTTEQCFKTRGHIFHQALVNHSRKYFNSSITMLVLHTEGVITEYMRDKIQSPRFNAKKAIGGITDTINDLPMSALSFSDYQVYNLVLERVLVAFNEHFELANPENASNNSRHKIAHGHAIAIETEANSLKQFLYLNEVYRLFSFLDKETYSE